MTIQAASETRPDWTPTAVPIGIRPLTPHIGAKIEGVDLSQPLSQSQKDDIRRAWLEWQVLVFRDQELTREQHKDFGRSFGPLHVHPLHKSSEYKGGHDPEILVVKTTQKSRYTAGDGWHTDVSCDEQAADGVDALHQGDSRVRLGRRHTFCRHVPRLRDSLGADAAVLEHCCPTNGEEGWV